MPNKNTGARKAQPPKTRATCRCCEHTVPIELMAKAGKGKHANICKICDAARSRERYHRDPEATRARRRAVRARNPERYRERRQAYYQRHVEKLRAAARERARTPRGRELNRQAVARYKTKHPNKVAAHKATQQAVRSGKLKRPECCEVQGCNQTKDLAMHHHRYDAQSVFKVTALCRRHHSELHAFKEALPLKPTSARKWVRPPQHEARQ